MILWRYRADGVARMTGWRSRSGVLGWVRQGRVLSKWESDEGNVARGRIAGWSLMRLPRRRES